MNEYTGEGPEAEESPDGTADDAELVARAKKNDGAAIEELVRRYYQKAYALAYRSYTGDAEEARDLTQEAFLRAFRSLQGFQGKASFYTWLHRIVVNTCRDAGRRDRRRRWWGSLMRFGRDGDELVDAHLEGQADLKPESNPLTALSGNELKSEVRKALLGLSEQQRIVFELKIFEEMSIPEIARTMHSAEGTVKSHLFRATQNMRRALGHWAEP